MQVDINPRSGRSGILRSEIQERIKCCGRIRIQQCFTQPRLADLANGQILSLIPGITKTELPVPSLEIIAKFPQLSAQTNIKEIIVVSKLFMSWTGVVDGTKLNASCNRETRSVRKEIWDRCIRNGERVKRILNWHADTPQNYTKVEWIGYKRHSGKRRIEK